MRRNKNKYGYNFPFQVLPFNQPKNIPIGSTLIEYGSLKLKIVRVFIFVTPPLCKKKFLRFDPTLGSNNYELFAFGTKRNGPKQTICFCGKFLNSPAFSYDGSNPPGGSFIFGGLERTLVFTVDRFPMPVWRVGCEVF